MTLPLAGQHCVVTGGGDSTGLAIALRLKALGAHVHIGEIGAKALENALACNAGLTGTLADISSASDVSRLFREAREANGPIDVLVNVVGVPGPQAGVEDIDDESWSRTFAANVNGTFYAIRAVVPDMKKLRRGVIINFSSASTRTNMPHRLPYVASKWAVEGMTRALARELGSHGIRVNAILPGLIDNRRMQNIIEREAAAREMTPEALRSEYLQFISMRTAVTGEEIAETVAFLCSPAARHISGQLLGVDGNVEWEP